MFKYLVQYNNLQANNVRDFYDAYFSGIERLMHSYIDIYNAI